jgi:hypothetical protein
MDYQMPILKRRRPALCDVVGRIGLEVEVLDATVVVGVLLVTELAVSWAGLMDDTLFIENEWMKSMLLTPIQMKMVDRQLQQPGLRSLSNTPDRQRPSRRS